MGSKLYVQTEDHSSFKKIILSLDYLSELKCNFAYGNFKIHVICTAWCKTCLLPTPIPPHPSKRKEKIGHVTLLPWLFYVVKLWLDSWFKLKDKIDTVSYFPAKITLEDLFYTFLSVFWSENTTNGKIADITKIVKKVNASLNGCQILNAKCKREILCSHSIQK